MARSSRIKSTSESCSKSAVRSSNDPASSILACDTTLATACRSASRNRGWSSAMTRRVLTAVIYFLCDPVDRLLAACHRDFQKKALSQLDSRLMADRLQARNIGLGKAVNLRPCAPQQASRPPSDLSG